MVLSMGWGSLHGADPAHRHTLGRQAAEPGPGASPQDTASPAGIVGSEGLAAALSPGNVEDLYELLEKLGR